LWNSKVNNHNSMFDKNGRLWLAAAIRGPDNPEFCKRGSSHPSAKLFPIEKNVRQLAVLDPKTMQYRFVDTCFGSHHLQFGYDANDTIWTSGSGQVAGWLNSKKFDETGDAAASQGWTAFVLDTNGNGKRDEYTEPGQPTDPTKDMRVTGGSGPYAVMPSPVDGSIWYTVGVFAGRGAVLRLDPGPNPPQTALSEIYYVPSPGFGPRGGDADGGRAGFDVEHVGGGVGRGRVLADPHCARVRFPFGRTPGDDAGAGGVPGGEAFGEVADVGADGVADGDGGDRHGAPNGWGCCARYPRSPGAGAAGRQSRRHRPHILVAWSMSV